MLRLMECLRTEHDWRLVLLAVAVCLLTSFAGMNTLERAIGRRRRPSPSWLVTAGLMTGCGIWATHFIAILAFEPGFLRIDYGLTALSLALAAALVTAGFAVALLEASALFAVAGGLIVGTAIALMHYTGVAALDMPSVIGFSFGQVAASILVGQAFAMAAMLAIGHRQGIGPLIAGGSLLALAIVSHHFIGMSAMAVVGSPWDAMTVSPARFALSITITFVMAAVIVACTLSALIDRRARNKLAERNMQLDAALGNMSQGLCLFDSDGRMQLCNPRFLEIYGLRAETVQPGVTVEAIDAARRAAGTAFRIEGSSHSPEQRDAANCTLLLEDGRTVSITSCPLPDGGWVVTHSDISRRLQDEARIAHMAGHDPLTELANRSAFAAHLDGALAAATKAGSPLALISIDLDGFTRVNEMFGETCGDHVLRAVAGRLADAAKGAFLARLASDEFMIVSVDARQPGAAEDICGRISAAFASPFEIQGRDMSLAASVGVSLYPTDATDAETLRMHADVALRRAKSRNGGAVCFFEPGMDELARARRELQRDLASAVAAEELELFYQPQANDREIVSFEVLLRWFDRKRGAVPPSVFVPVAEELGLISVIDAWVLRTACREAARWNRPLPIAVNLSAATFVAGDVVGLVDDALSGSGLASSRLEIEITESVLIDDFASVSAALHLIKQRGVRIAMDDFGTGYSSLSYLQAFPFDKLKIDKAFISNAETNATSPLIVKAIIGLGHALGLAVLAEGVETETQKQFLLQSGCDELQGYLIGRPKPIGHYSKLVMHDQTAILNAEAI